MGPTPHIIVGVVLDEAGRPVPDVAVAIVAARVQVQDVAALTGADGRVTFAAPEAGHYSILATAADSRTARVSVQVEVDAPETEVELHLTATAAHNGG